MPDGGATAVSAVDMAIEATLDADEVPAVAGKAVVAAAVEAEVQRNGPAVKAVVKPAVELTVSL